MSASKLPPLLPADRLANARQRFSVATAALGLLAGFAVAGMDLLYLASVPEAPGYDDPAEGRDGEVEAREGNDLAAAAPVEAAWPEADTQVLDLSAGSASTTLGGLPVTVAKTDMDSPDEVEIGILPVTEAEAAGISGLLIAVAGDGGEVDVTVGYASMAAYYGGAYGSRLAAWDLPDCAAGAGEGCAARAEPVRAANDSESQTITFTVDTDQGRMGGGSLATDGTAGHAMIASSATGTAQTSTTTTVTALAAGESSEQGDYTATELAPSSEWTHGGSSGAFQWSYGISVPTVIGDLTPDITLSYSSQSSDGRTSVTNNQGSWIGEGFTYEPGYIERTYQSCSDDGHKDVAGAGDQCWAWDNVSISLGGASGNVVKDGDTWRIASDDGSKVEHFTGASNGDNDGEYWKVTTLDGTQYFFGKHKLPGYESTDTVTNSTWTVPVFGDDSGEPCYNATFEDAYCDQAWRWNLDWVVTPTGSAMSYYYAKETNYYTRYGDTTVNGDDYTRAGYLKSIQYGLRSADAYSTAPAKVVFTTSERCIAYDASSNCSASALTDDTAANWPDVPWDRNCASGTTCEATQASPTFWTRKRLTAITTQIHDGTAWQDVDRWALTHSFISNGDTTRTLWLDSITRTGKAGSGADITLPPTTLLPVQKENRIDKTGDSISALIRPRLATVYTDTGGQIHVSYSGSDCTPTDTPTPASNERRCFPVIWQPASYDEDITDWFHKYVVAEVTVSDRTAESLPQVTRYTYANPAWRKNQYQGIGDETTFTWADWRGYATVTTTSAPDTTLESKKVTNYYQGMHGDETSSGGTRTVTLTDALGYTHTDYNELAGRALDSITYDDGAIVSTTSSDYWRHVTATDTHSWGDIEAAFVRDNTTRTDELKADGTWRRTSTDSDYDDIYGLVTSVDDFGDGSTSTDNRCTTTEYAKNTSAYLIEYVKRVETVAVKCGDALNRATQVISDDRTLYDSGTYGTAPTEGLVTAAQELAAHDGTNASYATISATVYDDFGRAKSVTDAAGNSTTTTYSDTAQGINISETVTNALGHVTTTTYELTRHLPVAKTDANAKTTNLVYDALGRLTEAWLPNPSIPTDTPYLRFSYSISDTAPVAVSTETLEEDGTYSQSISIFDGLLRKTQTQETGPDGGRLITDTIYDELGRTAETRDTYFASGAPSGTLLIVDSGETDLRTLTEYDDLGRVTVVSTADGSNTLWNTSTEYWADRTTVTAPEGGTATTTITDARDNTTEFRQYLDNTPTGDPQITRYTYTPAGDLSTVVDFDSNTWTFEYDQRGRKIQSIDPDTGKTTYTYDPVGNLTSTTDARGQTISTVYDKLNRVVSTWDGATSTTEGGVQLTRRVWDTGFKGYETGSISYEDEMTITRLVTTRTWDYQPIAQRLSLSGTGAGSLAGTYSFGTAYYRDGTVKGRTWSAFGGLDAEQVVYDRDEFGRVTAVTGADGVYANNVFYQPTGQLASAQYPTQAAILESTWVYGEANRLAQTWARALDRSGTLSNTTYDYDDAGNLLAVIDNPTAENTDRQAECYNYDGLRRLTAAWTSAASGTDATGACAGSADATGVAGAAPYSQSYTFDDAGNRATLVNHDTTGSGTDQTWRYTYGTETAHTLETVTESATGKTTSVSYDETGNTTGVLSSTGFSQDIAWDAEGRIESIATSNAATGANTGAIAGTVADGTVEFFYDADGERVLRDGAAEMTLYVEDVEITLSKAAGTLASTRTVELPGGATRIEEAGGAAQVQLADEHGTGSLAFDTFSGDVTRRYVDPYGRDIATTTTAADGDPVWLGQNGYVGGTIDPTGYTHINARDYNPATGRFLSADPVADWKDPQQLNGFAYSNNNPVTFSDPTGMLFGGLVDAAKSVGNAVKDAATTAGKAVADAAVTTGKAVWNNAGTISTIAGTAAMIVAPIPVVGQVAAVALGGASLAFGALDMVKNATEGNWADVGIGALSMLPGVRQFKAGMGVFKATKNFNWRLLRAERFGLDRLGQRKALNKVQGLLDAAIDYENRLEWVTADYLSYGIGTASWAVDTATKCYYGCDWWSADGITNDDGAGFNFTNGWASGNSEGGSASTSGNSGGSNSSGGGSGVQRVVKMGNQTRYYVTGSLYFV
jgi:RHS repeat-associated protein